MVPVECVTGAWSLCARLHVGGGSTVFLLIHFPVVSGSCEQVVLDFFYVVPVDGRLLYSFFVLL